MKYETLFESESDLYDQIVASNKDLIESGIVLYRGGNAGTSASIKSVRKDRQPRNTDIINHKLMDNYFLEYYGAKARSSALFVTRSKPQARYYGSLVSIVPMDTPTYIYSTKVFDAYKLLEKTIITNSLSIKNKDLSQLIDRIKDNGWSINLPTITAYIEDEYGNDLKNIPTKLLKAYTKLLYDMLDKAEYKVTRNPHDLDDANAVEIMVVCDQYYEIPIKSPEAYKLELNNKYIM